MPTVMQEWTGEIPLMQQTVLLTAIRGPDGLPKYGAVKMLLRWFRRCILLSALDQKVLDNPYDENGGSFTGPSFERSQLAKKMPGPTPKWMQDAGHEPSPDTTPWQVLMDTIVDEYLRTLDAIPHHFQLHFMHAVEILGYKHPDDDIRLWWNAVYLRLVNDMHLHPETEEELDSRLGDSRSGWLERADPATTK